MIHIMYSSVQKTNKNTKQFLAVEYLIINLGLTYMPFPLQVYNDIYKHSGKEVITTV